MAAPMALQIRRGDPGAFSRGVRIVQSQQENALRAAAGRRAADAAQREDDTRNAFNVLGPDLMSKEPGVRDNALAQLSKINAPAAIELQNKFTKQASEASKLEMAEEAHVWKGKGEDRAVAGEARDVLADQAKLEKYMADLGESKRKKTIAEAQYADALFTGQDSSRWPQMRQALINFGGNPKTIPETVTEEQYNHLKAQAAAVSQLGIKKAAPSAISKMMAERDALAAANPNDPAIAVLDDVIKQKRQGRQSVSPYQNLGPYVDADGTYIGEGLLDKTTGRRTIGGEPIPSGSRPRTEAALDKSLMTGQQFHKLAGEAADEERSLRQINHYMANVESTEQGWSLIADQLSAQLKTVFGKELDAKEYRTLLQNGQLQVLLGAFRKEVVGGGVMTEYDAFRVVQALGGNLSMLRNKKVAIGLLKEIMQEKALKYNSTILPQYNFQRKRTNRGAGFTAKEPIKLNYMLGDKGGIVSMGDNPDNWDAEYQAIEEGADYYTPKGELKTKRKAKVEAEDGLGR